MLFCYCKQLIWGVCAATVLCRIGGSFLMCALGSVHIIHNDEWPNIHKTLCPLHKHLWSRCFYFTALTESFLFLLYTLIKKIKSLKEIFCGSLLYFTFIFKYIIIVRKNRIYLAIFIPNYSFLYWMSKGPLMIPQGSHFSKPGGHFSFWWLVVNPDGPGPLCPLCPLFTCPYFQKSLHQDGLTGQNKGLSESLPCHSQLPTPKDKNMYHCTLQIFSLQQFEE